MILRIFEARVAAGRESEMHATIRQHGLAELRTAPGCRSAIFARRMEADGSERTTVVSTWDSWADLERWTGGQPTDPVYFRNQRDLVDEVSVRLFEVVETTGG